ncbi:MAG: redoxin domain-containing protein [bacterium]|nr:redoxin domain-containing protein [bacterium]
MSQDVNKKKSVVIFMVVVGLIIIGLVTLFALGNRKESSSSSSQSPELNQWVGKQAPDFTLKDAKGNEVKLADYRGKKLILFFTEGLMCYPACWNQMAALGQDKELNNAKVATLSIVNDSISEWDNVLRKMPELASETVLFDTDRRISSLYNVLALPSSMHPGDRPGHTYLILDEQGIVRFVSDDPQMGVRNNELLEEIKKMGGN